MVVAPIGSMRRGFCLSPDGLVWRFEGFVGSVAVVPPLLALRHSTGVLWLPGAFQLSRSATASVACFFLLVVWCV